MTRKTAVARFAIIVCAVLFTMVVSAQQITLKPGAIPDRTSFTETMLATSPIAKLHPCWASLPWLRSTTAALPATVAQ